MVNGAFCCALGVLYIRDEGKLKWDTGTSCRAAAEALTKVQCQRCNELDGATNPYRKIAGNRSLGDHPKPESQHSVPTLLA